MIASHGVQTLLVDLLSAHRLAWPAHPQPGVQQRRAPRAATCGRGAAPTGRQTTSLLAGAGHPRGVDPTASQQAPTPSVRHAADAAALASGPGQTPLDQASSSTRTAIDPAGRAEHGVAAAGPGRHRAGAAPRGTDVAQFLSAQAEVILAADFLHVDTMLLKGL